MDILEGAEHPKKTIYNKEIKISLGEDLMKLEISILGQGRPKSNV